MIGHLNGTVIDTKPDGLIVSAMGVGYLIACKQDLALRTSADEHVSLFTHLVVRENALNLYGFEDELELQFFELLITISGIGPKVALSILNIASPETLYHAITSADTSVLTKVSGIGKKNAEKIVLELKNKMNRFDTEFSGSDSHHDIEVFEALEALGFNPRSIQEILKDESLQNLSGSKKIKEAIKLLGK